MRIKPSKSGSLQLLIFLRPQSQTKLAFDPFARVALAGKYRALSSGHRRPPLFANNAVVLTDVPFSSASILPTQDIPTETVGLMNAEETLRQIFDDNSKLQTFLEQKGEMAQKWLDQMQQV